MFVRRKENITLNCPSNPWFGDLIHFSAILNMVSFHQCFLSSVSDPHIKVTGLPDDVREAKDLLLAVLDTKV